MTIMKAQTNFLSLANANAVAAGLNSDLDEDWTYEVRVVNAELDYAAIEMYDEDGELVGDM